MSQRWGVELAIVLLFAAALTSAAVYFRGREPRVGPRGRIMTTAGFTALGAVAFLVGWTASEPGLPGPADLAGAPPPSAAVAAGPRVPEHAPVGGPWRARPAPGGGALPSGPGGPPQVGRPSSARRTGGGAGPAREARGAGAPEPGHRRSGTREFPWST